MLGGDPSMVCAECIDEAMQLLSALTHQQTLEDFLTLPAYERID